MPFGAPVMRSAPDWVFGKAITSRMFSSPAKIADETVDAEGEASVGRRAVPEGAEQEAEATLDLLVADAERPKDA